MMITIPPRHFLILLLSACILSGCMRLGQRPPTKTSYVITAQRTAKAEESRDTTVLQVMPVRISPRFNGRSFVYRQDTSQYQMDFYNGFLIAPANLVQEEIVRWLSASGRFAHVSSSAGPLPPDYLLLGRISELYGDYRSKAPTALLAIEFMLLNPRAADHPVRFQQNYRSEVALTRTGADALVEGWNKALTGILENLEKNLGEVMDHIDTPPSQVTH